MISKNDVMVIFSKQRTSSGGLKMLYFMAIVLISTLLMHFKANIRDISVTIFRVVIFMSYVGLVNIEILFCIALLCCIIFLCTWTQYDV